MHKNVARATEALCKELGPHEQKNLSIGSTVDTPTVGRLALSRLSDKEPSQDDQYLAMP